MRIMHSMSGVEVVYMDIHKAGTPMGIKAGGRTEGSWAQHSTAQHAQFGQLNLI